MRGEGPPWSIWVDTGGTFTDCVAVPPAGGVIRTKVLSSGRVRATVADRPDDHQLVLDVDWDLPDGFFRGTRIRSLSTPDRSIEIGAYRANEGLVELCDPWEHGGGAGSVVEILGGREAPILAAHWVTRTPLLETLPPVSLRLATTRGTNALLERRGSRTVLFITEGFGDLLEIGSQQRPDLFSLEVSKPPPLYEAVVEVPQRTGPEGEELRPLDVAALEARALELLGQGFTVAAVALLHSYRNPKPENELARFLEGLGFQHVSRSAALAPLIKIVPRAETAVVNAYLSESIGDYLREVERTVDPGPVHVLTSAGGLVRSEGYRPKDSLLSGPAGGVVGAGVAAMQSGWPRSLAFDMGGTSTDVSRFDGEPDYRFETTVGDVRLLSPSLAIETVAAGGGSICRFDGRQLKVGPESGGADPGPACYGAGGPLTLTDVNLLLGRLRAESFEIPIDLGAAERAVDRLVEEMATSGQATPQREVVLRGLLEIANERMAEAVRRISIRQGYRPAEFALVAFGGAGGQHACALAEILGIETVLVPEDAGLLSAVGLGAAEVERMAEEQVLRPLDDLTDELSGRFEVLSEGARELVLREGFSSQEVEVIRSTAFLRLVGQEASLGIPWEGSVDDLVREFGSAYLDHYGYEPSDPVIEVESLRVVAGSATASRPSGSVTVELVPVEASSSRSVMFADGWLAAKVFDRESLSAGARFGGPALVFERHCATVVHPQWNGWMDGARCLVLQRVAGGRGDGVAG